MEANELLAPERVAIGPFGEPQSIPDLTLVALAVLRPAAFDQQQGDQE